MTVHHSWGIFQKQRNKKNCMEVLSSLSSFVINSSVNGRVLLVFLVVVLVVGYIIVG